MGGGRAGAAFHVERGRLRPRASSSPAARAPAGEPGGVGAGPGRETGIGLALAGVLARRCCGGSRPSAVLVFHVEHRCVGAARPVGRRPGAARPSGKQRQQGRLRHGPRAAAPVAGEVRRGRAGPCPAFHVERAMPGVRRSPLSSRLRPRRRARGARRAREALERTRSVFHVERALPARCMGGGSAAARGALRWAAPAARGSGALPPPSLPSRRVRDNS
jgi:hypothetical protein